jgi:hypothetical protein
MKEQILYKARTIKIIQHFTEYMSIIIDRMNTSNVLLKMPLIKCTFVLFSSTYIIFINMMLCCNFYLVIFLLTFDVRNIQKDRLKLFIHGIINHNLKSKVFYSLHKHWPHGTDFVTSILHNYLVFLFNSIPADNWPHTLYLQVDNCWRENKNTIMLRYLGLLLHFGWFKTIEIYSLSSGHTHENIDQMFSTWNIHY